MSSRTQVNSWLIGLGESVGKYFKLDGDGIFVAENPDNCEFVIEVPDDNSQVVYFYSPIASAPDAEREKFFEELLKMNMFGSKTRFCTISFDVDYNKILLHTVQELDNLDSTTFANIFNNFIETATELKKEIASILSDLGNSDSADSNEELKDKAFGMFC